MASSRVWQKTLPGCGVRVGAAFVIAGLSACASPPPVSHIEDKARLDVPIAVCRKPLAAGDLGDAGAPRADVYWSVLLPSFGGTGTAVRADELDCVGEPARTGATAASDPVDASDVQLSSAGGGRQIAWLPFVRLPRGRAGGVLALVRPRASEIDVYAVGRYEGSARHSRFEIGQLGTSRVVIAHDEGCADEKVDVECESTLRFYVVAGGTLVAAADAPAERLRFASSKGLGRLKYRLTTAAPVFDNAAIRVHETVQVRDVNDEDVRKAEGDRVFVLRAGGQLTAQEDSLWSKVGAAPQERR